MKREIDAQSARTNGINTRWGMSSMTLWIMVVSIALAVVIGFMLLRNPNQFSPSAQRNPVENSPVSGSQSAPPQAQPQTRP
jgi:hypothetical protein